MRGAQHSTARHGTARHGTAQHSTAGTRLLRNPRVTLFILLTKLGFGAMQQYSEHRTLTLLPAFLTKASSALEAGMRLARASAAVGSFSTVAFNFSLCHHNRVSIALHNTFHISHRMSMCFFTKGYHIQTVKLLCSRTTRLRGHFPPRRGKGQAEGGGGRI